MSPPSCVRDTSVTIAGAITISEIAVFPRRAAATRGWGVESGAADRDGEAGGGGLGEDALDGGADLGAATDAEPADDAERLARRDVDERPAGVAEDERGNDAVDLGVVEAERA